MKPGGGDVALLDTIRMLDFVARKARRSERAPALIIDDARARLAVLLALPP